MLSGFSWEHGYHHCRIAPGGAPYFLVSSSRADLPTRNLTTRFNALFRQCAGVSLLRRHIAHTEGNGFFTVCPSAYAFRLRLRSRLTLIRLALIRNPWSYGGRVSRPPYRYLSLHLLFRSLQQSSRLTFCGYRNAPLPIDPNGQFHGFGNGLMPDYYPRGITRLVSCYALFK